MNENTNNLLWQLNPAACEPPPQGILNDFRVVLRGNLPVAGKPSNAGSKALENFMPIEDAAVVKRLKNHGAWLAGMSQMSELGFGITKDTAHRLIGEKQCNAFLGTESAGEIRYLAAMAGAWGYKPSSGICSNLGAVTLLPSMECIGVIAETPAAVASILFAVSGKEDRDFSMLWDNLPVFPAKGDKSPDSGTAGPPIKVGVIAEQIAGLDEADKNAFEKTVSGLVQKGIPVTEVSFPDYDLFRTVHQVIGSVEASSSAGKYDGVRYGHRASNTDNWNDMYLKTRQASFGTLIKAYLFQGAFFQFENYPAFEQAARLRNLLFQKTGALFEDIDFIASPLRISGFDATRAQSVDDVYDALVHALPANVLGLPALCAPGMTRTDDRDLGLQIMAPHLADEKLLNFAAQYLTAS